MMTTTKNALLVLILSLLPMVAQAQIFMCKDATGKTLTSDRPIPECTSAVREFGSSGQLKRTIPPPLTAEQKKQKIVDEEKRKAEATAVAEQKRQDMAMLARYNSEAEINAARKRALEQALEQKRRNAANLAASEKQLASAQAEITAFNEKYKAKPIKVPQAMTQKVELADAAVQEGKKTLEDQDAQIAQINIKFDDTLKRFNELTAPATK